MYKPTYQQSIKYFGNLFQSVLKEVGGHLELLESFPTFGTERMFSFTLTDRNESGVSLVFKLMARKQIRQFPTMLNYSFK